MEKLGEKGICTRLLCNNQIDCLIGISYLKFRNVIVTNNDKRIPFLWNRLSFFLDKFQSFCKVLKALFMGLAPRLGLLLFISFNKAPSVEAKIYTRHVKSVKNVKNIERFFMSSYQGHQKHHVIFKANLPHLNLDLFCIWNMSDRNILDNIFFKRQHAKKPTASNKEI